MTMASTIKVEWAFLICLQSLRYIKAGTFIDFELASWTQPQAPSPSLDEDTGSGRVCVKNEKHCACNILLWWGIVKIMLILLFYFFILLNSKKKYVCTHAHKHTKSRHVR